MAGVSIELNLRIMSRVYLALKNLLPDKNKPEKRMERNVIVIHVIGMIIGGTWGNNNVL